MGYSFSLPNPFPTTTLTFAPTLDSFVHPEGLVPLLLVDEGVPPPVYTPLQQRLEAQLLFFSGKEWDKTREAKARLEDLLFARSYGRSTHLIVVGGGVTLDMGAFLASTYLRGLPLSLIPTTLLAMVDAALGGKTGINTHFGKNSLGTFYPPFQVYLPLPCLTSLPVKEWRNGLAEMLKLALVSDPLLWEQLQDYRVGDPIETLLERAIRGKLRIVQEDPFERTGKRHLLNFGHTVGHALELLSHYTLSHGEAVALGSLAELFLSHRLGHLSASLFTSIVTLYKRMGFPLQLPPPFEHNAFVQAMRQDKKGVQGVPQFVLIEGIGRPLCRPDGKGYSTPVPEEHFSSLFEWL